MHSRRRVSVLRFFIHFSSGLAVFNVHLRTWEDFFISRTSSANCSSFLQISLAMDIHISSNFRHFFQEDEYAYVQYKLPDEELQIIGYTPLINSNVAHHMLTYACAEPASNLPFWIQGGTCRGEQMIVHGWGLNAPSLKLPQDVGFPVAVARGDNSGNQIILSRKLRKYHAGIMLGATGAILLPSKTKTIRTPFSCEYDGPPISIFAVRVHAHQWARVNSLYRVRDGTVSLVTKGNPQWPQAFYPLSAPVQIEKGDFFIGQCVYDNNDDRIIHAGSTHSDEMCNVYAMYSYEATQSRDGRAPVRDCWGDTVSKMSSLLPEDSLIAPPNPDGITTVNHDAHGNNHETTALRNSIKYTNIETWPEQKTTTSQLGHVGGIALNNVDKELVVFHRGTRRWESQYFDGVRFRNEIYGAIKENVLTHIDTQTGLIKSQWGANLFYMPHGLTIDHRGNFWLTDIAMHQVFMFKSDNLTHPVLTVGQKFQSGTGPNRFCRPADVAVMKNGDFFVADGYCNSRIVKFNAKGEFIKEWGSSMSGMHDSDDYPLPNEWNVVHSIALNEDAYLLCAADRENFRIQCFHSETGNFLRQIHVEPRGTNGAIYAIEFAPHVKGANALLFAVTGGPQTANEKIYVINAQNGEIVTLFERNPPLSAAHDITVSRAAAEVYVGELVSPPMNSIHKFVLQKDETKATLTSSFSETTMTVFKKLATAPKIVRVTIVIAVCTLISTALTLILFSVYRILKSRQDKRSNSYSIDLKNNRTSGGSLFTNWLHPRQQGFDKLEQDIDEEEDQLLNSDDESQATTSNVDSAAVQIEIKEKTTKFNKRNNPGTLKLSNNL
ncbi:unnamed protein product [Adineta ricciae]|uniref:Peptidylamidoglycolate lyase n=1 Tax=Adineta ricciae TaxID=249248 RepID=A0A814QXM0_ADIRI|nr:unnamed protein product [Adineta ricciae]